MKGEGRIERGLLSTAKAEADDPSTWDPATHMGDFNDFGLDLTTTAAI